MDSLSQPTEVRALRFEVVEMKKPQRISKDGIGLDLIGAYVPTELKDRLQEWANSEDRTLSKQVERILREALESKDS